MITALEKSCTIWLKTTGTSVDTRLAQSVLKNILKRLNSIFECNDAVYNDVSEYDIGNQLSMPVTELRIGTTGSHSGWQHKAMLFTYRDPQFSLILTLDPYLSISWGNQVVLKWLLIGSVILAAKILDLIMLILEQDAFDTHIRQIYTDDQSGIDRSFQSPEFGEENYIDL